MCFGDRFSFRAEASSRGDRVKNDVPIRLSASNRKIQGHWPSWLRGRQASCLPANRSLEASDATKSCELPGRPSSRRLSDERIYYADKRMLLSLNQDVKNLNDLRFRASAACPRSDAAPSAFAPVEHCEKAS